MKPLLRKVGKVFFGVIGFLLLAICIYGWVFFAYLIVRVLEKAAA